MPDPTVLTGDLDSDLRKYFALTTSTELPRRVSEMSARTLSARRSPVTTLLAGGLGVLATAALVFVVATHAGSHNGASNALSAGSGAITAPAFAPKGVGAIAYPGVDTSSLSASGVLLLPPAGHGSSVLTAGQARAAADSSVGGYAATSGPAILAFAEITNRPQPTSCLCWVVDVSVPSGVTASTGAATLRTELVLVDAVSGRIAAVLSGHGIP